MQGTWKTTSGSGTGAGGAALAIGAAVAVVALAPVIVAAVVAIVKALVIGAVALAVAGVAVWRMRSHRPLRQLPVRHTLPQVQARVLPAQQPDRPAVENHHYHFHGVSADDVAAAIARNREQS